MSFRPVKGPKIKWLTVAFYVCENGHKNSSFVIYSYLKHSAFTAV